MYSCPIARISATKPPPPGWSGTGFHGGVNTESTTEATDAAQVAADLDEDGNAFSAERFARFRQQSQGQRLVDDHVLCVGAGAEITVPPIGQKATIDAPVSRTGFRWSRPA